MLASNIPNEKHKDDNAIMAFVWLLKTNIAKPNNGS